MMFGHCEGNSAASWAQHLGVLRDVQRRAATLAEGSGCITEFVPLPFVHMEAPIYLKGKGEICNRKRSITCAHGAFHHGRLSTTNLSF